MTPRTRPMLAVLVIAGLLAGCGVPDTGPSGAPADTAPADWAAVAMGRVDVEGGLIQVAAPRDGIVATVHVEEGDRVRQGDVLAVQDDRESRARLAEASARLEQAEAEPAQILVRRVAAQREADRLAALVDAEAASRRDLDETLDRVRAADADLVAARAAIAAARAARAAAAVELEQRVVRAPIDGTIARRLAQPGVGVSTLNTTTLFTLVPAGERIVRGQLDERFVPRVSVGRRVMVSPESSPDVAYEGEVLRIGQVLGLKPPGDDPDDRRDARVVEVVLRFADPGLLVGQRVVVRFAARPARR